MLRGSVPTVNSRAEHTFSRSPQAQIQRSAFNRSHGVKTTFDEGYLVPILCDEMLPGDTFKLSMSAFARLQTLKFPLMDNLYLETFFFSVPYRLLWDNWEKFNGYQVNPGDNTDYLCPYIAAPVGSGVEQATLADYMGIPTGVPFLRFNAFHFRAYNLIWNDWFRDENLQDSVAVNLDDGPDDYADYELLRRGKRYDYFTSCLPFPQKGPDVTIPLGTSAPVVGTGTSGNFTQLGTPSSPGPYNMYLRLSTEGGLYGQSYPSGAADAAFFTGTTSLEADLTDATAATINDLRLAFQTQKMFEKDARGGTRYTEVIKCHFGVTSPDMRLQRPEYLGGGSSPVLVNPIAQTAPTTTDGALGDLGAYGVCAPHGHGFVYSATEHCVLLGLVMVRADINYQQGLERMWSRQTRLDFYWPSLAHLGEQAVLNKEIYAQGPSVTNPSTGQPYDEEVFGYQERFGEYRYKPSMITGLFRSQAEGTLDSWHLAQQFMTLPQLNEEFIIEDAPMSRIQAVTSQYDFLLDVEFKYHCVRPMPVFGVPGQIDRF